jgi:transposase
MGLVVADDGWRIPDGVWAQMEPLLPEPPSHPLGCHRPRVPDRDAMNAILLVLRTGMQWNALDATGICSCSSAYRRFRRRPDQRIGSATTRRPPPRWPTRGSRRRARCGGGYSITIESPGSSIPLIVVLHVSPGDTGKGSVRVPVEMTSPARTAGKRD